MKGVFVSWNPDSYRDRKSGSNRDRKDAATCYSSFMMRFTATPLPCFTCR